MRVALSRELAMVLRDWFRQKQIPDADADRYADAFIAIAIPDNEQELPQVGLTRIDLRNL